MWKTKVEDDDLILTSLQHFFLEFPPLVSEPLFQVTFALCVPAQEWSRLKVNPRN